MESAVIPEEQTDKYRMQHDKEFREKATIKKTMAKDERGLGLDDEY